MEEDEEVFGTSAFHVPPENISDGRIEFPEAELHHLQHVLRQGAGSRVEVLDGAGRIYLALVEKEGPRLVGRVLESRGDELPGVLISAAVALGRKERMRFAVEKLAELGCHRIFPLVTAHVSFQGNPARMMEKMEQVCIGALKQSRRPWLTRVEKVWTLEQFLENCAENGPSPVFCLKKTQSSVLSSRNKLSGKREYCVVVGPEGGFSPAEMDALTATDAACLDLGPYNLRFETAAVAGFIALRQMLWQDINLY